jgi:hypothetical protein
MALIRRILLWLQCLWRRWPIPLFQFPAMLVSYKALRRRVGYLIPA